MSALSTPTEAPLRLSRLVFTGDDGTRRARIQGSQQAEFFVGDRDILLLLVSDGSLVSVKVGRHTEDFIWRVHLEQPGTAKAEHREPDPNECSERLELVGPDLRVFSATAYETYVHALIGGHLRVADLVEPARLCERFLSFADPHHEWVTAWNDSWSDRWNGIVSLRYVLAMRDARKGTP